MRGDFVRVAVIAESINDAGTEIGIDVDAVERWIFLAAIDVAANHTITGRMVGKHSLGLKFSQVCVFHDGVNILSTDGTGLVMMRAFTDAPAVIAALDNQINFLPQNLA